MSNNYRPFTASMARSTATCRVTDAEREELESIFREIKRESEAGERGAVHDARLSLGAHVELVRLGYEVIANDSDTHICW